MEQNARGVTGHARRVPGRDSDQHFDTVDERGEVFPVAILFVGVLLTILIGVHVVLHSVATTAVQTAADHGVVAAQAAALGPMTSCPPLIDPASGSPASGPRQCQGGFATWAALNAATSMVRQTQLPAVTVDSGIVSVVAFGSIMSPVLGPIEVVGRACGPLDLVAGNMPTSADPSAC